MIGTQFLPETASATLRGIAEGDSPLARGRALHAQSPDLRVGCVGGKGRNCA